MSSQVQLHHRTTPVPHLPTFLSQAAARKSRRKRTFVSLEMERSVLKKVASLRENPVGAGPADGRAPLAAGGAAIVAGPCSLSTGEGPDRLRVSPVAAKFFCLFVCLFGFVFVFCFLGFFFCFFFFFLSVAGKCRALHSKLIICLQLTCDLPHPRGRAVALRRAVEAGGGTQQCQVQLRSCCRSLAPARLWGAATF